MTGWEGRPYNGRMNIIRLLLIALLVGLLYRLVRFLMRPRPVPTPAAKGPKGGEMRRCAECGLHVPAPEAIRGQQGDYCSEAHRARAEGE